MDTGPNVTVLYWYFVKKNLVELSSFEVAASFFWNIVHFTETAMIAMCLHYKHVFALPVSHGSMPVQSAKCKRHGTSVGFM